VRNVIWQRWCEKMNFLKRIQNLPLRTRKVIIWIIVIILGVTFFVFWLINVKKTIKNFPKEEFIENLNFPSLKEIPKLEILNKTKN
jgi:CRISPR/Cas system-associated protein Csx1